MGCEGENLFLVLCQTNFISFLFWVLGSHLFFCHRGISRVALCEAQCYHVLRTETAVGSPTSGREAWTLFLAPFWVWTKAARQVLSVCGSEPTGPGAAKVGAASLELQARVRHSTHVLRSSAVLRHKDERLEIPVWKSGRASRLAPCGAWGPALEPPVWL